MKKLLLILSFLFLLFCTADMKVSAAESDALKSSNEMYESYYDEFNLSSLEEALSSETREELKNLGITLTDYESFLSLNSQTVWQRLKNMFGDRIKAPLSAIVLAMTVLLLAAIFGGLSPPTGVVGSMGYLTSLSIATVVLAPLMATLAGTISTLSTVSDFMLMFIPVFVTIIISSGRVVSGTAYSSVMLGLCETVGRISATVLAPTVSIFVCLGVSASVSGNDGIYKLSNQIKSIVTWTLGLIMTVFTGFLGIQSVIGKAADNLTVKTTKFFVGSVVPVVGGALSEALTTVAAGIGLLRSGAAIWCVIVLAILLIPVLIELFLWRMALGLLSSFSAMFSLSDNERLFSVAGVAVGFLIALVLCVAVMFILSLALIV